MTGHNKRIDASVPFVAVNIAILTVSDSRTIADDKSVICWWQGCQAMAIILLVGRLS